MMSAKIREDFPLLQKHPELIYLDNAATSLKPRQIMGAIENYYLETTANVGRGSHRLSQEATQKFEESRSEVAKFLGAKPNETIFTRNATEAINLAAVSLERQGFFRNGDEIVISMLEHHANLIPWQQLCLRTGTKLKVVKLNSDYTLDMEDMRKKVSARTKMVAIAHVSNTVASIQPVKEIGKIAHDIGALLLVDGAQSAPHMEMNVKGIGADFFAASSHKMLGPTGIGVLYVRQELLAKMPPYNYGGGMIKSVSMEKTEFGEPPARFEAGTMPIGEAFGFAEACRYLRKLGMGNVMEHERQLTRRALQKLSMIEGLKLHCPANTEKQGGIVLFSVKGVDPVDLGVALDEGRNIAVRTGFMCAEPVVRSINPKGLVRASFYMYNTIEEIDAFSSEVAAIARHFG